MPAPHRQDQREWAVPRQKQQARTDLERSSSSSRMRSMSLLVAAVFASASLCCSSHRCCASGKARVER
eukprot:2306446-Rhodomonas_salina.1